mgnify:CR=1 FL=1
MKTLRKELGYSRKRMARLFGVSPDHYRKYERGERGTGLLIAHIKTLEFLKQKRLLEKFERQIDALGNHAGERKGEKKQER